MRAVVTLCVVCLVHDAARQWHRRERRSDAGTVAHVSQSVDYVVATK